MNGLVAGLGILAGAALAGRRRGVLSELGLTDEQHAAEMLRYVENVYGLLNRAEDYLAKRKSSGRCVTAYRSLKNAIVDAALAHENLKAMQTGRSKYDPIFTDMSRDYDSLLERMTRRCGTMTLQPVKRRKCVRWGRKGKKRYCKKYSTTRTR